MTNHNGSAPAADRPAGHDDDSEALRVLDAYLSGIEAGEPADPQTLLADHPALADRLQIYLRFMHLAERPAEQPAHDATRLGRYQLQGEIARGGMGSILRGRDVQLGRDLAIKVLLEAHQGDPEAVRRFVEEAQIGGQLQHPGVVPIYDLGTLPDRRPCAPVLCRTRARRTTRSRLV